MAAEHDPAPTRRHRPRAATVFIAAFVAGAAAAVGINRVLDVHLAQSKPQVECEPIFVALRSLPQGVPVTVWDVALRDWPKAMMPMAAVRVNDTFAGCLLKHPLREGQPLLTVQLLPPASPESPPPGDGEGETVEEMFVPPVPATVATPPSSPPTFVATAIPDATVETMPVAVPESMPETTRKPGNESDRETVMTPAGDPESETDPVPATEATAVEATAVADAGGTVTGDIAADSTAVAGDPSANAAGSTAVAVDSTAVAADATTSEADDSPMAKTAEPVATPPTEQVATGQPPAGLQSTPAETPNVGHDERKLESAPQPALAAIRQEPTPAAEPPLVPIATAPAPAAIGPHLLGQPSVGSGAIDLPSRPVADVASLPSILARDGEAAPARVGETADSSVRYLVVPERIAQQADTSFTTPAAPAVASVASDERPVVSQQPASVRQPGPRQPTGRQAGSPPTTNRSGSRTAAGRNPATAKQPQTAQPKPSERAETESNSWGSMFPNVSAGIEAIGKWRNRGREAVADESRAPQPRR